MSKLYDLSFRSQSDSEGDRYGVGIPRSHIFICAYWLDHILEGSSPAIGKNQSKSEKVTQSKNDQNEP